MSNAHCGFVAYRLLDQGCSRRFSPAQPHVLPAEAFVKRQIERSSPANHRQDLANGLVVAASWSQNWRAFAGVPRGCSVAVEDSKIVSFAAVVVRVA